MEEDAAVESGVESLHRSLGRAHSHGGGSMNLFSPSPGECSIRPAAAAVQALRFAPTADAALRGLDRGPRRPNNPVIRAKERKKNRLLGKEAKITGTTFTQNQGHYLTRRPAPQPRRT